MWRGGVIYRIDSELIQYKINDTDNKSWVDRDSTLMTLRVRHKSEAAALPTKPRVP